MTEPYAEALARSGLMAILAPFDPHVAGTLPLGLAMPGSDIDLLCHAPDPNAAAEALWASMRGKPGFAMRRRLNRGRPLVASFMVAGWPVEVFAAPEPVARQAGWRHFCVERRLLGLGGPTLRERVMAERRHALKTEPAFARVLGLEGDPYDAVLALYGVADPALRALLDSVGRPALT